MLKLVKSKIIMRGCVKKLWHVNKIIKVNILDHLIKKIMKLFKLFNQRRWSSILYNLFYSISLYVMLYIYINSTWVNFNSYIYIYIYIYIY